MANPLIQETLARLIQDAGPQAVGFRAGQTVSESPPTAIFPGSFNPRHTGHQQMARLAAKRLGTSPHHEISIHNVDKPTLSARDLVRRLQHFADHETVWITNCPTFESKAPLFPNAWFVIGFDTLLRLANPAYAGSNSKLLSCCRMWTRQRNRFLVFGRTINGQFQDRLPPHLPNQLADLCEIVPESDFRSDLSSSHLRNQ